MRVVFISRHERSAELQLCTPVRSVRTTGLAMLMVLWWIAIPLASAAITYVDATTTNTTLHGTALVPGSNYTSGSEDGANDNLWHLRTGVGNGNGVWTLNEEGSGSENALPLVTTMVFPEAGGYTIFAYIWDAEEAGQDWGVKVRAGGSQDSLKIQASEVEPANGVRFSSAIVTGEGSRRLMEIPLGVVIVAAGETAQVHIEGTDSGRTWYDGVGYERAFGSLDQRLIAIDFNKTNAPAAPSQAMFRVLSGSGTVSQNSTSITKAAGPYSVLLTKASATRFDFRGANGDAAREIPGGPISLSFLVADFIGARDGTINISISDLPAGTYLFRSRHLDTFNSVNLGFAQGSSATTRNTLRAHVSGSLKGITQPTALGASGLATTFISDADIPTLSFPFSSDGSNAVGIHLSTLYANGADRFILLNGFEVIATTP